MMRLSRSVAAGMMLRAMAVAPLVLALSGCLSVGETTTQSQPMAEVATSPQPVSPATAPTGPVNTGRYPTFGAPLTAANVQMENDQALEVEARLSALALQRRSGSVSEAEYQRRLAELRQLANDHGTAAEAEIAN